MSRKQKRIVIGKDFQDDGHTRVSRGEDWVVEGGTKESHEETTDIVHDFSARLRKEGDHVDVDTAREILKDVVSDRKRRN